MGDNGISLQVGGGINDPDERKQLFGNEPSEDEYKQGLNRIIDSINKFKPKVIIFIYKRVLDKIIDLNFGISSKSSYGFNFHLDKYFNSRVFVFPMPGTPCRSDEAIKVMNELKELLKK
jgi:hypothetical protein